MRLKKSHPDKRRFVRININPHKMAFLFLSNRFNKPKGVKNAKRL
jgi:hypothetical protein